MEMRKERRLCRHGGCLHWGSQGRSKAQNVESDESADAAKSVFKHKISPRESPGPLVCFTLSTYVSAVLNPGQNAVLLYECGPDPVARVTPMSNIYSHKWSLWRRAAKFWPCMIFSLASSQSRAPYDNANSSLSSLPAASSSVETAQRGTNVPAQPSCYHYL